MPTAPRTEPAPRRPTKTMTEAIDALHHGVMWLRRQPELEAFVREQVPDAWHTLEMQLPEREKKEKVTLYLDRSVARVFRAMGCGYQERINVLLRSWLQLRIAGFLQTEDKVLAYLETLGDAIERETDNPGAVWDKPD